MLYAFVLLMALILGSVVFLIPPRNVNKETSERIRPPVAESAQPEPAITTEPDPSVAAVDQAPDAESIYGVPDEDRLLKVLHSQWSDLLADYGFSGVSEISNGGGNESGYFANFEYKQISTSRRQKPILACSHFPEQNDWKCDLPPQYKIQYQWQGQQQPFDILGDVPDDAIFAALEFSLSSGLLPGEFIQSIGAADGQLGIIVITTQSIGGTPGAPQQLLLQYEKTRSGYSFSYVDTLPSRR